MIKNVLINVTGAVFLSVVCEMIMPEGSLKKYLRLAIGFIMAAVLISPIAGGIEIEMPEFSFGEEMSEDELTAKSDALVLKMHRENVEKRAEEIAGEGSEAYAEIASDGSVRSVRVIAAQGAADVSERLKAEFGCEDVVITWAEDGT
ncbi:MAG: stage III sporulation protein AF [Clostridia bacterium]|nr:stage III sporulation protein AF [Clostridia bacterium]